MIPGGRLENADTIVAVATPPGKGGIGIVRISGPKVQAIARHILTSPPAAGLVHHCDFLDSEAQPIDRGIALIFSAPHSYTGEDVLELQGHGSPATLQMLVSRCLTLGARLALPGEFTKTAFLNGRLDLAQAEAVADLINSHTETAARSALRLLKGGFSEKIQKLADAVTHLRVLVEASIDFPEEEIDFLSELNVIEKLQGLTIQFEAIQTNARQGRLLRDGLKIVLTGLPNAGKSSLLNALSKEHRAIVSNIPGTTRDTLEQFIEIDGLPVEITDTAGIRESRDEIEAEGVRRALAAQQQADLVVLVVDDMVTGQDEVDSLLNSLGEVQTMLVRNKIDLSRRDQRQRDSEVCISALTGQGIDVLRQKLKLAAGFRETEESPIMARQRHLDVMDRAKSYLAHGLAQQQNYRAAELLAEDLSSCHKALGEITGEVSSDDLLGLIFSSFCIGK